MVDGVVATVDLVDGVATTIDLVEHYLHLILFYLNISGFFWGLFIESVV
jgi:hypothetical protein